MVRHMREAVADLRRDIERWETELISVERSDANEWVKAQVGEKLRAWIAEGKSIIDGSGY